MYITQLYISSETHVFSDEVLAFIVRYVSSAKWPLLNDGSPVWVHFQLHMYF